MTSIVGQKQINHAEDDIINLQDPSESTGFQSSIYPDRLDPVEATNLIRARIFCGQVMQDLEPLTSKLKVVCVIGVGIGILAAVYFGVEELMSLSDNPWARSSAAIFPWMVVCLCIFGGMGIVATQSTR